MHFTDFKTVRKTVQKILRVNQTLQVPRPPKDLNKGTYASSEYTRVFVLFSPHDSFIAI